MVQRKSGYTLSILAISAIMLLGCGNKPAPPPQKIATTQNKPQATPVQPQTPMGMRLADLKGSGVSIGLKLEGKDAYREEEPIKFTINMKNKEGYPYILYLDSQNKIGHLYPNKHAALSEFGGKVYEFPKDFGGVNIRASKDCISCEKDKTVVYAFVSTEPIVDIKNITKKDLLSLTQKTKGIVMDDLTTEASTNLSIGLMEFITK